MHCADDVLLCVYLDANRFGIRDLCGSPATPLCDLVHLLTIFVKRNEKLSVIIKSLAIISDKRHVMSTIVY